MDSPYRTLRWRSWLALCTLLVLCCTSSLPAASSRDPIFSCFFAGTTSSGDIFVATSPEDLSGSNRVVLWGIRVPPKADGPFNKYVQKMLGGYLLHVRIKKRLDSRSIPSMVGEVMILQGSDYVNFNKSLLRDGYAELNSDAPPTYQPFIAYAKRKQLGLWAEGRPHWIVPEIKQAQAEDNGVVTDRDKVIQQYGIPNYTNRTQIPDNYSILQYHLYITDFYLGIGKVFIYRDGKLVNKQAYGK